MVLIAEVEVFWYAEAVRAVSVLWEMTGWAARNPLNPPSKVIRVRRHSLDNLSSLT